MDGPSNMETAAPFYRTIAITQSEDAATGYAGASTTTMPARATYS